MDVVKEGRMAGCGGVGFFASCGLTAGALVALLGGDVEDDGEVGPDVADGETCQFNDTGGIVAGAPW